ncbi:hypothetical protein EYF80_036651 [Liparis tanakae]|uniref:Uncharacterized protein n=1 Tax=Liparis tanakae TaxID=230148 RepID=A0A4Z2GK75_9TELE|nr:hypothetical protein EYF80_036651 [Liparis tanakae]
MKRYCGCGEAPCSMTVFMCVMLARNRAMSNMPSAAVFLVAYRFMFSCWDNTVGDVRRVLVGGPPAGMVDLSDVRSRSRPGSPLSVFPSPCMLTEVSRVLVKSTEALLLGVYSALKHRDPPALEQGPGDGVGIGARPTEVRSVGHGYLKAWRHEVKHYLHATLQRSNFVFVVFPNYPSAVSERLSTARWIVGLFEQTHSKRTRSNEAQPRVSRRREVTASLLQHEIFTKHPPTHPLTHSTHTEPPAYRP